MSDVIPGGARHLIDVVFEQRRELAALRARIAALEADREAFAREVAMEAWRMDMDFVSDSGVITQAIAAVKAARGET